MMSNIMRQIARENNCITENELMAYAKKKLKYNLFQTFLERKNTNEDLPLYCDVITVFYKGVPLIGYQPEDIKKDIEELKQYDLLNMSKAKLRKLMFSTFKNEIFFSDDSEYASEILLDDEHYKVRTLKTDEEMHNVIYD